MSDTWSIRLLKAVLKVQSKITEEVSPELKKAGAGRKARIVIEGDDGGELFLRWTGDKLIEDHTTDGVRNDFVLHSQTLLDLATGELKAREALAARLITVSGDRSIYDQEDIMQLFEKLQDTLVVYIQGHGL